MSHGRSTARAMRERASALLAVLDERQRAAANRAFSDDAARRWIEYRPRERPGISLGDLDPTARKAAHRLLATALSPHAYAQAMTIIALEEVLDRAEGWRRGRHCNDYWSVVFGEPGRDDRWGWRVEGHHLSVAATVDGDTVYPTPVFFGANPASVAHAGRTVSRPLAAEEDVARALLASMESAQRLDAIVADLAPADILSGQRPRAPAQMTPLGVPGHRLDSPARALLAILVGLYLERLTPELSRLEVERANPNELHFAWAGPERPGAGHYYRIQGPDLLIEYDNTQDAANHAHTVLRRPDSDFGGDPLAAHRGAAHSR